jgi:hypothetical protein
MSDVEENISFEYTPPPSVEFRLYYDESGKVITYTCEKLEGDYIIIDAQTYAEARPDIRVVNGKIVSMISNLVVTKLKPGDSGVTTTAEDISIIANDTTRKTTKWKITLHELG